MSYVGDIALGKTFDKKFTTVDTSGVPTTLAGTPVISAYPDNSTTEITAGITLSVDFDSRVGMHNVRVVATSGNGYATATNYSLVITTGTVGGSSVVGYVVGEFSIEARSSIRPTTADRTLDISAGGEAGIDWANIGSPTTAQNLSATNIDIDQVVASVSGAVGSVTAGVNVTQLGGVAQSLTDLKDFADDGYDPATNKVQGVVLTDTLTTYTGNTPQTGDTFARLGAPAGASVSADILVIDNFVDDIESRLGTPSDLGSGATIAANLVDIEGQTDDIGAAGAGLSALPWNAAWDAEVQSEVDDALVAQRLDELLAADSDIDGVAPPTVGSVFHELMTKTAGSFTYDQTTDSLEAMRDNVGTNGAALSLAKTTNITGFNDLSTAQVNAEVVDGLNVDTYAEPGQESPPATTTLVKKLGYIYKFLRNRKTQTATTLSVFADDAVTVDQKATISDNGTTYDHGEIVTGP